MTKLPTVLAILIFMTLTTAIPTRAAQHDPADEEHWTQIPSFEFPVWLALNRPPQKDRMKLREIFLFVETQNFTKENIKKVITILAAENPEPDLLTVTVYSDKEMLKRAIRTSNWSFSICFADTPEGKKATKEFYGKYFPLESGYYRAYYYRGWPNNGFYYSPDPNKEQLVRLD